MCFFDCFLSQTVCLVTLNDNFVRHATQHRKFQRKEPKKKWEKKYHHHHHHHHHGCILCILVSRFSQVSNFKEKHVEKKIFWKFPVQLLSASPKILSPRSLVVNRDLECQQAEVRGHRHKVDWCTSSGGRWRRSREAWGSRRLYSHVGITSNKHRKEWLGNSFTGKKHVVEIEKGFHRVVMIDSHTIQ